MATYAVPSGHIGAHAKTLVASTVDTVTFVDDLNEVEILTDGADDIYVAFGGAVPTVAGTDCFRIPAALGATVISPVTSGGTIVKLISAGTPTYSVSRA